MMNEITLNSLHPTLKEFQLDFLINDSQMSMNSSHNVINWESFDIDEKEKAVANSVLKAAVNSVLDTFTDETIAQNNNSTDQVAAIAIGISDKNSFSTETIAQNNEEVTQKEFVVPAVSHLFTDNDIRNKDIVIAGHNCTDGDDYVVGDDHNDYFFGSFGNDFIKGLGGEDVLYGDEGDDIIYGDDGNDSIFGGFGNDFIYGGAGKDNFIFDYFAGLKGKDTICDFEVGSDILDFNRVKIAKSKMKINIEIIITQDQNGIDSNIYYDSVADNNLIATLINVNPNDLTEANFVGVDFANDVIFM